MVGKATAHLVQHLQSTSSQSARKTSNPMEQIRDGTGPESKLLPTSKIPRPGALLSASGMLPSNSLYETLNVSVVRTRKLQVRSHYRSNASSSH